MDFEVGGASQSSSHRSSSSSSTSPPAFQLQAAAVPGVWTMRRRWWWPPLLMGGCSTSRAQMPAVVCVAVALFASAVVVAVLNGMPASLFFDDAQGLKGTNLTAEHLLDGLLTPEFRYRSCRSRYEFAAYHKKSSSRKPSPYLVAKLRKHEALQRRCGPGTSPYKKALRRLESGEGVPVADHTERNSNDDDCRYLVYISYRGLGNRMLAMASAFLYAVLTDRVLLVDGGKGVVVQLFCEPFPGATWLLPPRGGGWWWSSSPLRRLDSFGKESNESLGNMLQSGRAVTVSDGGNKYTNVSWKSARTPPYVYLHLDGGYGFHDKLFFCGAHQRLLRRVPWLLLRADSYFVPGLLLTPPFREQLGAMFPEKDAVFHHLGRYLFHPTNAVWRAVTSYYRSNLAGHRRVVGVQIRVYRDDQPRQSVLDQVLSCVRDAGLLLPAALSANTSVLVTSLSEWYSERIAEAYGGRVAGVHQPSHEGRQRWGDSAHDIRALGDMYLLSTCDVLLTSGFSTFGYVAQGLAGRRPWVMPRTPVWAKDWREELDAQGRACRRVASVEPCFHSPSTYDCAAGRDVDLDKVTPYIMRCEDVRWGIKLVNGSSSH